MKEFLKKYSVALAIIAAVAFLIIFFSFLFRKVGDDVYIVDMYGTVNIGTADDVSTLKPASVGMKLSKSDIVVTNDKSSCVLSYNKKASAKDNFINVGENSQVMLYNRNQQGGYSFFLTYGSLICNMPTDRTYRTNISTKLFNLFVDGTISKVAYDMDAVSGKVYTFDGNPKLQIIQPSGTTNSAEKLLKNSVCAVTNMDDGTVGFGCLNVGFGLNSLTAQDLRTMSGVANTWAEKISYGSDEFEQAFQTASDYAKWAATEPAFVTTFETSEYQTLSSDNMSSDMNYTEGTTVPASVETDSSISADTVDIYASESEITEETTLYTVPTGATQTVPEQFMSNSVDANGRRNDYSLPATAFSRETVYADDFENDTYETVVTTVPRSDDDTDTDSAGTHRPRETSAYKPASETTVTAGTTIRETAPSSNSSTTINSTANNNVSGSHNSNSSNYYNTGTKPVITTTVPATIVDKNATFTVIFSYVAGGKEYWAVQLVKYGNAAIVPEIPDVPGKRFVKWDKDFSCVTSNMTIGAVFVNSNSNDNTVFTAATEKAASSTVAANNAAKDTYTVSFYVDSKLWKTVTVKAGETAKISDVPTSGNKRFCGWSDSLTNVRSDMTVFALFSDK